MSTSTPRIGLIGIGLLGTALAERLLEQGLRVTGYDLDSLRRETLDQLGGAAAPGAGEVLQQCDTILLSLPTSATAAGVLQDCQTLLQRGRTIIDTTTGEPEQMIANAELLKSHGADYLEATVAGSSTQARQGKAVLFVGGDADAVARQRPLLDAIATTHFYLGQVGAASRFKLVHNLILGLNRAVLAEGLVFAEALGFELEQALEILQQTPATSGVMATKGRKMVDGDLRPQARLSQHLKDVRLIIAEASRTGAPVPLSQQHQELLETAEQLGFGDADNSAVIEAFRSRRRGGGEPDAAE